MTRTSIKKATTEHTAKYSPASRIVRAAARRSSPRSMFDPRTKTVSIPIVFADDMDAALWLAGVNVEQVIA